MQLSRSILPSPRGGSGRWPAWALLLPLTTVLACGEQDLREPAPRPGAPGDVGAGAGEPPAADEAIGAIQLALTSSPADAGCLRVTAAASRTVTRLFDLPGKGSVFTLERLPVGIVRVDAVAFASGCAGLTPAAPASWVSEAPVDVRVEPALVAQVALKLIRNGKLNVGVEFERAPWITPGSDAIDLAIIGDSPYGAAQIPDFPNLVAAINADPRVSTVVHVGDIKNGSTRCDTSYFHTIFGYFAAVNDPLIFTPGDNEWTDCHRASNGGYDPLERLAVLRQIFFPVPGLALGGGRKQVLSQDGFPGFTSFVENQLWFEAKVAFSVVHVVGSNNGLLPWYGDDLTGTKQDDPARRQAETAERIKAALDWLDRSFALAVSEDAAGVAILMQADTWEPSIVAGTGPHDGFDAIVQRLAERARSFGKPVLLVQGDTHVYLADQPLLLPDPRYGVAAPVPNLQRVVVQGSTTREWLRLHVDPATPAVFSWERMFRP